MPTLCVFEKTRLLIVRLQCTCLGDVNALPDTALVCPIDIVVLTIEIDGFN